MAAVRTTGEVLRHRVSIVTLLIILMVFWSFGQEPDALVLDELCDDTTDRVGH